MDKTDPVIDNLIAWGAAHSDVRAILLTSTRAVPGAKVDALSDYDVILVVNDVLPFAIDREWIEDFGPVLVTYWDPFDPATSTGASNVVQYDGRLKIDFGVWSVETFRDFVQKPELSAEFDAGYRVLLDKDALAATLSPPSQKGYVACQPDEAAFLTHVNDFFSDVPYVAKCLVRDDILPGKWCLDYDMRYVYLLPMLEWFVAINHGWDTHVGNNGKGLKARMSPELWQRFETTFAGADIEDNWRALFAMVAFFDSIGDEVATALGFTYPHELSRKVTAHARQMRDGTLA